MTRVRRSYARTALLVLALQIHAAGGLASAAQAEVCDVPPASGPISIIILQSGRKVHELAAALGRGAAIVAKDPSTVVFADGRVITADVDAATRHLNELGWGHRRIDVVASFSGRRARPRRRVG